MPGSPADPAGGAPARAPEAGPSFREAVRTWAWVGLNSFGGPAGQIAVMHALLVERKRWISERRFLHALNYCMLLPGPEAQQLAIYVGWLLHRVRGGLAAGILFVLPGFLAVLALSLLYAECRDLTLVEGLFFGIKPAVLAVVVEAVFRIGRRAIRSPAALALAAMAFAGLFLFAVPFPLVVVGAGIAGLCVGRALPSLFEPRWGVSPALGAVVGADQGGPAPALDAVLDAQVPEHTRPSWARAGRVLATCLALWFVPLLLLRLLLGPDSVFVTSGLFFSQAAVVTFGGAYAVLAYVAQKAVLTYAWLLPGEMLDGLGLAETTPGPLILVLEFVGFMAAYRNPGALPPLLAGTLGALLTTWVTFVPCFLWIFLGAPWIEALRGVRALTDALSAITAAVVGVILNLALWFAVHTLFGAVWERQAAGMTLLVPDLATIDWPSVALAAAALLATFRWRIGMLPVLGACAAAGAAWALVGAS
ncbi:MAG TPA: chromate efflux transporter [Planctomycetota bacterium]|nr:chromate efflux transporter [Planctomycetota bacterium]